MATKNKIINGIFWVSLSTLFTKVLSIVVKLMLARLLEPTEFGLIALIILTLEGFSPFSDFGLGKALIYHDEKSIVKASNTSFFFHYLQPSFLLQHTYLHKM